MQTESKELSIKEILHQLTYWWRFLYSKRKVIIIWSCIGALIGLTYAWTAKKKYTALLTFALEEKSSGLSGYASIASQFGLDLGGQGGGAFSGDNLVELLKSRMMVEKTLLSVVMINDTPTLLLDRYINFTNMRDKWDEKEALRNLTFSPNRESYTVTQDSILNLVQADIRKKSLVITRKDKKLNIVEVTFKSKDELFAKKFTELLVQNASSFYIETKTRRSRANIRILETKIDSVKRELDARLYGAAMEQDGNINVNRARMKVPLAQKQIDIQMLTSVYAELSKNLEISRFSLMREEPLIQIIDTPILPLKVEKPGRIMYTILLGFIFAVLSGGYYIAKRLINEDSND